MKTALLVLALTLAAAPVRAQGAMDSAMGLWRTVDDKTGRERALVRIFEANGAFYGRIERLFDPAAAGRVCDKCEDDRKGKPLVGLDIVRGLRRDGEGSWGRGEILDPESGSVYRASARLAEGGRQLVVRGSVLGGLVGRSQTWLRAE